MEYICPTCGKKIDRDLVMFMGHTEKHIADEIKKHHPEWQEEDGICKKCLEYYRRELGGRG